MKVSKFNYELPEELIAQDPIERRDQSRLLVVDRNKNTVKDEYFYNIIDYLKPGDTLVLNESRVMPSRIFGHRPNKDEKIEVLLLKNKNTRWQAMVRPGRKMKVDSDIIFSDELKGKVVQVNEDGTREIDLEYQGNLYEIMDKIGAMPLPPYIHHSLEDKERYQTVFSKNIGSAAAPTAGLHFTEELLMQIKEKGIKIAKGTLHVGLGTFRPVFVDDIKNHKMHSEYYELDEDNAKIIQDTIDTNGRIIAVGTTSVRILESIFQKYGEIVSCSGETDIFIYPGFNFKVIDGLITNFHLPESTLLMLVSAFYDREKILEVYQHAIEEKYRFFSFGDGMFIY